MGRYDIGGSTSAPAIKQGATFTLNVSLTSTSSTATAFNLTGYSVRGKMRSHYDSTAVTASFTGTILSATGGTMRLTLGSTVTQGLTAAQYVYDAEIYTTAGVVNRVLEGRAIVTPEVTY